MHSLIGQGLFDLLEPRGHLRVRIIDIVLQIPSLERIVRIRGHLLAALLIRLENESLTATAEVRSMRIDALLIAWLLRLALVHILLAETSCETSWTAAGARSRTIATVLAARGANSCK